ncbi:MAG: phasin family protein, partial [Pseudomonadota bacterium]
MATAKNKSANAATEATAATKSALNSIQENVSERASAAREQITTSVETVRETGTKTAGAAVDFGKAYYSGLSVLGQTIWGFGQEVYGEVTNHAQKTMQAKSLSDVASLQAAFVQTRIETSAAHSKE